MIISLNVLLGYYGSVEIYLFVCFPTTSSEISDVTEGWGLTLDWVVDVDGVDAG